MSEKPGNMTWSWLGLLLLAFGAIASGLFLAETKSLVSLVNWNELFENPIDEQLQKLDESIELLTPIQRYTLPRTPAYTHSIRESIEELSRKKKQTLVVIQRLADDLENKELHEFIYGGHSFNHTQVEQELATRKSLYNTLEQLSKIIGGLNTAEEAPVEE